MFALVSHLMCAVDVYTELIAMDIVTREWMRGMSAWMRGRMSVRVGVRMSVRMSATMSVSVRMRMSVRGSSSDSQGRTASMLFCFLSSNERKENERIQFVDDAVLHLGGDGR